MEKYLKCNKAEICCRIKSLENSNLINQMKFSSWFYRQFQPEYSGWAFRICSYRLEGEFLTLYSESKTRCFKIDLFISDKLTYQEVNFD